MEIEKSPCHKTGLESIRDLTKRKSRDDEEFNESLGKKKGEVRFYGLSLRARHVVELEPVSQPRLTCPLEKKPARAFKGTERHMKETSRAATLHKL